jgi:hypothetical protein
VSARRARYAEADSLYRIALSIRERAFGVDHPRVASTLISIASLKRDVGEYREADPLLQTGLSHPRRSVRPRSPSSEPYAEGACIQQLSTQ